MLLEGCSLFLFGHVLVLGSGEVLKRISSTSADPLLPTGRDGQEPWPPRDGWWGGGGPTVRRRRGGGESGEGKRREEGGEEEELASSKEDPFPMELRWGWYH